MTLEKIRRIEDRIILLDCILQAICNKPLSSNEIIIKIKNHRSILKYHSHLLKNNSQILS